MLTRLYDGRLFESRAQREEREAEEAAATWGLDEGAQAEMERLARESRGA